MLQLCKEHKSYYVIVIAPLERPLYMVNVEQVFAPSDRKCMMFAFFLAFKMGFDHIFL